MADLIGGGLEARGSGIGTGSGGEGEGSRLPPRGPGRRRPRERRRRRPRDGGAAAPGSSRPRNARLGRGGPERVRMSAGRHRRRARRAAWAPEPRRWRGRRGHLGPRPRRPRDRGLQPTRNRRQVSSSCWGPVGATHTQTGLKATRTSPDVEPDATAGQAGAAARHPGRRRPREPVPPARGPIAIITAGCRRTSSTPPLVAFHRVAPSWPMHPHKFACDATLRTPSTIRMPCLKAPML